MSGNKGKQKRYVITAHEKIPWKCNLEKKESIPIDRIDVQLGKCNLIEIEFNLHVNM